MKTSTTIKILCLGLLVGMALTPGCKTVNTIEPAQAVGNHATITDKRVITDDSLSNKVAFVGLHPGMTDAGFMRIQVDVLNLRNSVQSFNYKVEWFDMNGMIVNTAGAGWIQREILGGETLSLTSIAPTQNCRDFRIKFVETMYK